MTRIFDLFVLLAISVFVILLYPSIGILFLLVNLVFGTQYWKTQLLLGSHESGQSVGRKVKAGILAVLLAGALFVVLDEGTASQAGAPLTELWNGDFFPIVVAIGFLTSLLTAALVTERRKR